MLGCRQVFSNTDRRDVGTFNNPDFPKSRSHGIGNIVRAHMTVMLFHHAGVGMAQLRGNNRQRRTVHDQPLGVGVAQLLERQFPDLGRLTRGLERALLVRLAPSLATVPREHQRIRLFAGYHGIEECAAFVG